MDRRLQKFLLDVLDTTTVANISPARAPKVPTGSFAIREVDANAAVPERSGGTAPRRVPEARLARPGPRGDGGGTGARTLATRQCASLVPPLTKAVRTVVRRALPEGSYESAGLQKATFSLAFLPLPTMGGRNGWRFAPATRPQLKKSGRLPTYLLSAPEAAIHERLEPEP